MGDIAAAKSLFRSKNASLWRDAAATYPSALAAVAARKKKDCLVESDKWLKKSFPAEVCASSTSSTSSVNLKKDAFTHAALVKIMEWKLTRGKFRPLMNKLKSNTAASVRATWNEVVSIYSTPSKTDTKAGDANGFQTGLKAVEALCELTAVGPATATAKRPNPNKPQTYAGLKKVWPTGWPAPFS